MQCFYLTLHVYLARFVVMQEHEENLVISTNSREIISSGYRSGPSVVKSLPPKIIKSDNPGTPIPETTFLASVSIADLLKAGKLVKPSNKNKVTLTFEKFEVHKQEWQEFMEQNIFVETEVLLWCIPRCI